LIDQSIDRIQATVFPSNDNTAMPITSRRSAAAVLSGAHSASATRAPLRYDIRERALNSPSLWRKFFRSTCDQETEAFLQESQAAISYWRDAFASFLLRFVSRTDANAIAGRGELFVFSQAQAMQLLGHDPFAPPASLGSTLLDVGAGNGAVTARLAPFFERVVATEFSGPMVRCLRARGFEAVQSAELSASTLKCDAFDVIVSACMRD
jgi:SAM-dependent methyltransferase